MTAGCLNIFPVLLSLVGLLSHKSDAFESFVAKIPNGNNVPNPCGSGTWKGVGHENSIGTGTRNLFGSDFKTLGQNQWTMSLCQKDSDGDGKTNGAELGDPNCNWAAGQSDPTGTTISHPGICEPIDSATCLNSTANQFLASIGCSGTSSSTTISSSSSNNNNAGITISYNFGLLATSMLFKLF